MLEPWKQQLVRKHFDGEKRGRGSIPEVCEKSLSRELSVKQFIPPTGFHHVSQNGVVEEGDIQFLNEDGWESVSVQAKDCGLNVCSIILICRRDFFYKEPLWGKKAGGGAMWKGVWDWLVARAKLKALKWWGHSSLSNQVGIVHSKHTLFQLCTVQRNHAKVSRKINNILLLT